MRAVKVYRMDYTTKTKYFLGVVIERRKTERVNNYNDLLRLARITFGFEPVDDINIIIDVSRGRRAYPPEPARAYLVE